MITTTTRTEVYNGSGSAGPFTIPFPFPANSDITAAIRVGTGGAQLLTEGADYTLSGSGYFTNGGTIALTLPLAIGTTLTVTRMLTVTQPTKFRDLGAFFPQIHEQALDRLCMIIQQLQDQVENVEISTGSGISLPPTVVDTTLGNVTVPLPASGTVVFINGGDMGHSLILEPSVPGQTIMHQPQIILDVFNESITLSLVGMNWYKI